jgi:pectinesterase
MPPIPKRAEHLLVVLIVAFAAAATSSAASDDAGTVPFYPSAEAAAAAHCDGTLYPELCLSTLADIPDLHKKPLPDVICAAVNRTEDVVTATSTNCSTYLQDRSLSARDRLAINDCLELLSTTMDELRATTADLESPAGRSSGSGNASAAPSLGARRATMDHVMTVLSAAITNQYTCLDGFAYQNGGRVRHYIEPTFHHVSRMVSNSLAMAKKLPGASPSAPTTETAAAARQPFMGYGQMVKGFPRWVRPGDRRLLQAPATAIAADAVVAKDGSGGYTTVSAAVAAAPTNSKKRYVIYIKAGAYMENVEVGKKHVNLMFVGDGIGKTVIKASRNVVDGYTTFRSATVGKYNTN